MQKVEFNHEYDNNHAFCYHCRGFYGQCYRQPLCTTCHHFLSPADPFTAPESIQKNINILKDIIETGDEHDSGNEEPKETPNDCPFPRIEYLSGNRRIFVYPSVDSSEESDSQNSNGLDMRVRNEHGACRQFKKTFRKRPINSIHDFLYGTVAHKPGCPAPDFLSTTVSDRGTISDWRSPKSSPPTNHRTKKSIERTSYNVAVRIVHSNILRCLCVTGTCPSPLQKRICKLSDHHSLDFSASSSPALPPELWTMIFGMLDDMSLWQSTRVCVSWRELILRNWGQDKWKEFTLKRWRLFKPIYKALHWYSIFSSLIEVSPCDLCHMQMFQPMNPQLIVLESSWRMNRLQNEDRNFRVDPPEGIEAIPFDENCLRWHASIRGPDQSPYQGGTFFLHIIVPPRYPLGPPIVRFVTKIFHPNVSCHGDIGLDSIQHNWSLALTISKILISIQSLLTDPYTKVCMDTRAGNLYEKDRAKYETIATEWTWRYAMVDVVRPSPIEDEIALCDDLTVTDENSPSCSRPENIEGDDDRPDPHHENNQQDIVANENNEQDIDNENNEQDIVNENNERDLVNENNERDLVNENNERDLVNENNDQDILVNDNNEQDILVNENNEQDIFGINEQDNLANDNNEQDILVNNNEQDILVNDNEQDILVNDNNEQDILVNDNNEQDILFNDNNE